jgi:hypothetical protein
MMGFKSFRCARIILAGIETMHMIKKGQLDCLNAQASSAADQFYSLAFLIDWRPSASLKPMLLLRQNRTVNPCGDAESRQSQQGRIQKGCRRQAPGSDS